MTDIKQICTRLIELWDADCDINMEINELRAALAEPEPKRPTDEELLAAPKEAIIAFPPNHPSAQHLSSVKYEIELQLRKARAILARWGK